MFISPDDYLEGLHVIKDILPVLDDKKMGNVLNAIRPLLTHVDLDLRLLICDILDGLMMNDPSLTFLVINVSSFLTILNHLYL